MTSTSNPQLIMTIESAGALYHRLVLLVGPPRSGKTSALRSLHEERGWPLLNLNLALSEKLLELTKKQRALRVARIVDELGQQRPGDTLLIDNLEMLFHPDLQQDPLRLLHGISRNRTIVAAWRGSQAGSALTYGSPDHPEFRRYDDPQALIVSFVSSAGTGATSATQEHSA